MSFRSRYAAETFLHEKLDDIANKMVGLVPLPKAALIAKAEMEALFRMLGDDFFFTPHGIGDDRFPMWKQAADLVTVEILRGSILFGTVSLLEAMYPESVIPIQGLEDAEEEDWGLSPRRCIEA